MCFSPEASFAGGVVICAIGVATVKSIHKPSQLVFALIPIFFGVQQINEGFLWLSLLNPDFLFIKKFSLNFFLIMANVFWPMMIPLATLKMEPDKQKQKLLRLFLATGILLSLYYLYCIVFFNVNPRIVNFHIQYDNNFPASLAKLTFAIYLLVTITPLFISSVKRVHYMGMLMFLSCLVTLIFFMQYLTSVWCFFAALISVVIFWILRDSKREFQLNDLINKEKIVQKIQGLRPKH